MLMRWLRMLIVVGLGLGSLVATVRAVEVTVPERARARATVLVDEVGNVLFGSRAGKVEVTNLPQGGGGTVFTVLGATTCPMASTLLYSGSVYQAQINCQTNPTTDGLCWQTPPSPQSGCGYPYAPIGPCAVCRAI